MRRPAGATSPASGRGSGARSRSPTTNDEAALGQLAERVLEAAEVVREQELQRLGVIRAQPAPQRRLPRLLRYVGKQLEQERQLRPGVFFAGDDRERVAVQDPQELLVREAEERLQA